MKKIIVAFFLICFLPVFASAVKKKDVSGFSALKKGEFKNVSLSIDGEMKLSRVIKKLKTLNETFGWDFVYYKNFLYIAAGEKGKIYKMNLTTGEFTLLTAFPEGTVYSIEIYNGALYAGVSPLGKIFKVKLENGKYSEFFDTKCKYVWQIKKHGNSLYIATGLPGKLIEIDSNGLSKTLSSDFDKHYESLAFGENAVFVGTYPSGSVIRVKNGKSFLIYQSKYREIKDMEFFNGKLYAVCYSGNPTVNQKIKSKPARKIKIVQSYKGALVSIDKNNVPQILYTLRTTAPYCLKSFGDFLYIGTGHSGKILSIDKNERLSVFGEVDNGQVMKMLTVNGKLYMLTSNTSDVYYMKNEFALDGEYISEIFDAGKISEWGVFYFNYKAPTGTRMEFFVRCGNSDNPELTWGNWVKLQSGFAADIPSSKMVQFKVRFISHDPGLTPLFKGVNFYYREANLKPLIAAKVLAPQGVEISQKNGKSKDKTPTYEQFVSSHKPLSGTIFVFNPSAVSFYLIVKDPNGDKLNYSFYLEDKKGKRIELKKNSDKNYVVLNTLAYPEKAFRFYFKVSDKSINYPDGYVIDGYSDYFVIDNTPPSVSGINFNGKKLSFSVSDASPVEVVKLSTDGGKTFFNVYPVDGINDEKRENYSINFDSKPESVIIKVFDSHGNMKTYLAD